MLRACLGLNYYGRMEELPGAFGSSASLALRLGQTVFSTASLLFMCLDVDFYGYTAFCYLVTVMGLVIPWSITLLVVDAYSVFIKCLPLQRRLIMIVFLGDMFFYTPDFVISLISCSVFNSQCHRSPARCRSILLPAKVVW
ncbi:CASP-like protein [Glycine soja]|uniref:CASP-like protein n=2 Tax=Glycine subgen. Soja TaxID=1462606 RepID=I1JCU7_SOYBN|nr:uncharacterized protein LOC100306215 isoform X1 [Glycine max]XP_028197874.1 CASP-like protein ARALYDRAFT_485429 isoform X2 [Glycine soja]|eukprot:XP_006574335.1 uncharacterized protein LOC100306215 isoform X1 [Glycine max]